MIPDDELLTPVGNKVSQVRANGYSEISFSNQSLQAIPHVLISFYLYHLLFALFVRSSSSNGMSAASDHMF